MSTSANDIIERAMVKARVISPGESIPSGKATQMLDELNDMLELWSLEALMIVASTIESFALTLGQSAYTYGTGGDFDSPRPIQILNETTISDGSVDHDCPLLPMANYRLKAVKTVRGTPRMFTFNPEFPLLKVYFYPTPTSGLTANFRVSKQLSSFASLTTEVDLAPGYRGAIVSSMAIRVCTNFGRKVSNELAFEAAGSKKTIKTANTKPPILATTPHLTGMINGGSGRGILEGPF